LPFMPLPSLFLIYIAPSRRPLVIKKREGEEGEGEDSFERERERKKRVDGVIPSSLSHSPGRVEADEPGRKEKKGGRKEKEGLRGEGKGKKKGGKRRKKTDVESHAGYASAISSSISSITSSSRTAALLTRRKKGEKGEEEGEAEKGKEKAGDDFLPLHTSSSVRAGKRKKRKAEKGCARVPSPSPLCGELYLCRRGDEKKRTLQEKKERRGGPAAIEHVFFTFSSRSVRVSGRGREKKRKKKKKKKDMKGGGEGGESEPHLSPPAPGSPYLSACRAPVNAPKEGKKGGKKKGEKVLGGKKRRERRTPSPGFVGRNTARFNFFGAMYNVCVRGKKGRKKTLPKKRRVREAMKEPSLLQTRERGERGKKKKRPQKRKGRESRMPLAMLPSMPISSPSLLRLKKERGGKKRLGKKRGNRKKGDAYQRGLSSLPYLSSSSSTAANKRKGRGKRKKEKD